MQTKLRWKSMKLQKLCGTAIVALAVSVLLGVGAQAAPITMTTSERWQ
jgi:hypothetical protein